MSEQQLCLSNVFGKEKIAIFCGAGISRNSGLPLVSDLKIYILNKLFNNTEEVNEIAKSETPFESFLEKIIDENLYSKLLALFKAGQPNATHIFIAKLAKHGFLQKIVTTNFDLLIEKAFAMEELVEDKDYVRFCNEEEFSALDSSTIAERLGNRVGLFKIHGSADDAKSVRTTLSMVASKSLSDHRQNLLRDIFLSGDHKQILIIGYSCSDVFDINPHIMSMPAHENKNILFIDHSDLSGTIHSARIEDIKLKEFKNPFKHFSGKRIFCNTDTFIRKNWGNLREILGEYYSCTSTLEWTFYVDSWYDKIQDNKALSLLVAGELFYQISNFDKAMQYYHQALNFIEKHDQATLYRCYSSLGDSHLRPGDPAKAKPCYEKALKIAESSEDLQNVRVSRSYLGLAECYFLWGNYQKSQELFVDAINLERDKRDFDSSQIICQANDMIGRIYCSRSRYDDAIRCHKKALDTAEKLGDISRQAYCYTNLGTVCAFQNQGEEAIKFHTKALHLAQLSFDKATEAGCYLNLAAANISIKQWIKAEKYLKEAREIAVSLGDETVESLCYGVFGNLYFDKWDFDQSAKCYYLTLTIAENLGYCNACLGAYLGLSRIHLVWYLFFRKNYELIDDYSQRALKYAKNCGNKNFEADCHRIMEIALNKLKKSKETKKNSHNRKDV